MLSGWLSLVFANQLCGILMRELTASYSACVPSNRSLSGKSHLHGRRLCFVGKDFTICHSLCHPTPPRRNLLARLAGGFFLSFSVRFFSILVATTTHTNPREATLDIYKPGFVFWSCKKKKKEGRKLMWYNKQNNGFQVPCLSPVFPPATPTVCSSLKTTVCLLSPAIVLLWAPK